jgi:hypothetical protein
MKNRKILIAIGILLIVVVSALIYKHYKGADMAQNEPKEALVPEKGEILIEGKIVCLETTQVVAKGDHDCVKGIKSEVGDIFAMNTANITMDEWDLDEGTKVEVVGTFEAPDNSTPEGRAFKYDGVLTVTAIQER